MTNARELGRYGHEFRPGPFHRHRAYWLDGAVLHWRIGNEVGHVPLTGIEAMRLDLAEGAGPASRCVLVETSGRVHKLCDRYWPRWTRAERGNWGRLQRRGATFHSLTFTLARRLIAAHPAARLETGPGRGEWIASWVVAAFLVALLIGGTGLMISRGQMPLAALGFMALAVTGLPMLWPVIRSGGARRIDPATLHTVAAPHPPLEQGGANGADRG